MNSLTLSPKSMNTVNSPSVVQRRRVETRLLRPSQLKGRDVSRLTLVKPTKTLPVTTASAKDTIRVTAGGREAEKRVRDRNRRRRSNPRSRQLMPLLRRTVKRTLRLRHQTWQLSLKILTYLSNVEASS